MKLISDHQLLNIGFALSLGALGASAQTLSSTNSTTLSLEDNFRQGWHEATLGTGVYFSNIVRNNNRPNSDYASVYANIGYMVTDPKGKSFYRGTLEVAPEIFGDGIFNGPGSYIAGATLWFRYNFVQPNWKVVPYLQVGGGGTFLDIPHSYDGKDFNFNLDAAVGLRYFITTKVSLNAEYRVQHISNADLWDHNVGVNTDGPMVGLSLFF